MGRTLLYILIIGIMQKCYVGFYSIQKQKGGRTEDITWSKLKNVGGIAHAYCTAQYILPLPAHILWFRYSRDRIAQANPDDVTLMLNVRIPFLSSPPLTPD